MVFGREKSQPEAPSRPAAAAPSKEPDMFETIFNLKFTAKQIGKLSKKSESQISKEKLKCKQAIQAGNAESAKIHAENAIRNEKQAVSYLRLQSRLDAVVSRLEMQQKMSQVMTSMTVVTEDLSEALSAMDMDKVSTVLETFEKQFENLDVQAAYVDGAIADSTSSSTPQGEVNQLLQQVADEHNLQLTTELLGNRTPANKVGASAPAKAAPEADDLEERLRKLETQF